jgi:hypothetical protein
MAHAQTLSIEPFRSVPFVEVRQSLPSKVAIISPFVDQLMSFIAKFRNVDGSEFEIELAVREALANAVVHGNHEDPHRHVYVVCRCSPDGEVTAPNDRLFWAWLSELWSDWRTGGEHSSRSSSSSLAMIQRKYTAAWMGCSSTWPPKTGRIPDREIE